MSKRNRLKREVWLTSAKVQAHACPACGRVMDGVTQISDQKRDTSKLPIKTGGIMVCAYCAAYGVFVDESTVRLASPEDLNSLQPFQRQILDRCREKIARDKGDLAEHVMARFMGRGMYG